MKFFKRYVLMLDVPVVDRIVHWATFFISLSVTFWVSFGNDRLTTIMCGCVFFGVWIAHALMLIIKHYIINPRTHKKTPIVKGDRR